MFVFKTIPSPLTFGILAFFTALALQNALVHAKGEAEVTAIIQVSQVSLGASASGLRQLNPNQFEVARNNLAGQVRSEFIISSALANANIRKLKVVKSHEPRVMHWLKGALEFEFPAHSELVIIRIKDSGDPEELKKLLDSVIRAVQNDIIGKDRMHVEETKLQIDKLYAELRGEYRSELAKYFQLSKELEGTSDVSTDAELSLLKLTLDVQRDFLKELQREVLLMKFQEVAHDESFRVLQLPMAVEE